MTIVYVVTPEVLSKFQEPFGTLIQGSFAETVKKLQAFLVNEKPPKLISVGDAVSRNLHDHHILPQLSITDNLIRRKKTKPEIFGDKVLIRIKNPQGTITQEAIDAIKNALERERNTQILVEGEEDLLTLIVVLYAPENSIVVYGQPLKGIVIVKVTAEKKSEAEKIWKGMKLIEKN